MEPIAIEPIVQKSGMDCGVACLAMYLNLPYRTVVDMALNLIPDVLRGGLTQTEMVKIATALGYPLTRSRKYILDDDCGILFCQVRKSYHTVVLFRGVIINPTEGMVWTPEAYFAKTKQRPITLLKLDSKGDNVVE